MSNIFSYVIVALLAFVGTKAFDMLEIYGKKQEVQVVQNDSLATAAETLKRPGLEECFSSTELGVLKNLKIRREQLDIRERSIEEREKALGMINAEAQNAVRRIRPAA